MNPPLLISLVLPVYNAAHTLTECLESILSQGYDGYEIILVNDGSTDGSQELIEQYAGRYPEKVKYVNQPNKGLGFARNTGIAMAQGTYLGFVDSDDFLAPNYFAVIDPVLRQQQPDIFVFNYQRVYRRKPSFLEKRYRFSDRKIVDTKVNIDTHPQIICQTENSVWIKMVKREIAKGSGYVFSEVRLAEDMKVNLNWMLKSDSIIYSNEVLYNYILDHNYVSTSTQHITDLFQVIDSVCEEYRKHGKFESCYAELELMFIKHLLVANMRRMKSVRTENKQAVFMSMRAKLMAYFPHYIRNRYLKQEPYYLRLAVWLSWYAPGVFRILLK